MVLCNSLMVYMKLTDKRFWIAWVLLLVVMVGCCVFEGWSEDTTLLGGAYAMSLLSTWLCHRIRQIVAYGNLIVMVVYNAILAPLACHPFIKVAPFVLSISVNITLENKSVGAKQFHWR